MTVSTQKVAYYCSENSHIIYGKKKINKTRTVHTLADLAFDKYY